MTLSAKKHPLAGMLLKGDVRMTLLFILLFPLAVLAELLKLQK